MSFSKEMREFIGAYNTGSQINARNISSQYNEAQTDALTKKTARENDPATIKLADDTAQANLDATRARTRASDAAVGGQAVRNDYTRALIKRLNAAGSVGDQGTGLLPPGMGVQPQPGVGATGPAIPGAPPAQPVIQNTMDPSLYAEGGAVPAGADMRDMVMRGRGIMQKDRDDSTRYADGGPVDEDADPNDEDDQPGAPPSPTGALPVGGLSGATDFSSRARTRGGGPAPGDPNAAIVAAYKYGTNAFGLPGTGAIKTPEQAAKVKALAGGAGALSPEEMEAARRTVDPEGKMPEGTRNMAALGAVYQYWANKGEPEKAAKVAFQMIQHYRLASERYAAIAQHAVEQGNLDLATKAALKAYANVPDGRDVTLSQTPDGKLQYVYTDENGKTLSKGIATPQQLASSAMGLAGNGFDKALLSAAGAREAATGAAPAIKGAPKPAAGAKALGEDAATGIDKALGAAQDKWTKENKGATADEGYWTNVKNTATHLQQHNPTATPDEVVMAAKTLLSPSKKETEPFKTTEDGDGYSIKFKSGHRMKLDGDTFDVVMNQRAALLKQMQDEEDKAKQPAPPNKYLEGAKKVGEGAVNIGRNAADYLRENGPVPFAGTQRQVGRFIGENAPAGAKAVLPEELYQRAGSDIAKIKSTIAPMVTEAVTAALDKLKNPNLSGEGEPAVPMP